MKRRFLGRAGLLLLLPLVACGDAGQSSVARLTSAAAPVDPCTAALAPGAAQTDRDRAIAYVQREAHKPAKARAALERLGYLYVARARIANDPGDYKLAGAAASCLEARYPDDATGLLLRGHVLHQLHKFHEAEEIARTLVARRAAVLDYGLLGDALMEQGRLTEATAAYQKMIDLKPFYQSYTRAAHVRWLKGDLPGAISSIRLAIRTASPRDPESSAWAWTRLAAYELQAGRAESASNAVDEALRIQPGYAAALLMRGRTELALNRSSMALDALRRAAELNPLPEYQWILADTLRVQGLKDEADRIEREITARGEAADPRTLSLYLATRRTDPARAVALAEAELRVRGDVFTLDAHAWALAAAGRVNEARGVMDRALAEGTQDARLFLHAAVIRSAAGDRQDALRFLQSAQRLNAMLLPSERDQLRAELDAQRSNQRRGTH